MKKATRRGLCATARPRSATPGASAESYGSSCAMPRPELVPPASPRRSLPRLRCSCLTCTPRRRHPRLAAADYGVPAGPDQLRSLVYVSARRAPHLRGARAARRAHKGAARAHIRNPACASGPIPRAVAAYAPVRPRVACPSAPPWSRPHSPHTRGRAARRGARVLTRAAPPRRRNPVVPHGFGHISAPGARQELISRSTPPSLVPTTCWTHSRPVLSTLIFSTFWCITTAVSGPHRASHTLPAPS